ncbi:MAG: carbohydrate porin [Candidatus Omnitrophica bacterium]|nr:carbohydrate porin [Candidatus Omnitrophota bacterium]
MARMVYADEEAIRKEIQELKKRIAELEEKLAQQDEKTKAVEEIKEVFEGFSIGGGATFVLQGTHNANNTSAKNEDVTDASYSIDLEIEKEFKEIDGKAFMHLETGQGSGVEDELTLFSNVNYDANTDESLRISEVYYEQNLFDKRMVLTFGKLDPTVYLDTNSCANDETSQFLGRIFRNSPTIEFPDNSFGFRLNIAPVEFFDIEFEVLDADADFEDAFDFLFLGTQLKFKPKLFGKEGNYRILGWLNDQNHTKWEDYSKDKEENYGFGISFDQELTDNLACFLRYGWQNPEVYLTDSSFSLEQAWSIGLQIKGSLWRRENDILGLAIGQAIPSKDYKKADPTREAEKESHFEAYYNIQINEHLHISPDIQVIWNPYGDDVSERKDTITVFGSRIQVDF